MTYFFMVLSCIVLFFKFLTISFFSFIAMNTYGMLADGILAAFCRQKFLKIAIPVFVGILFTL